MISKLGAVLLIAGLIIGIAAYAAPPYAILNVEQTNTSLSVMASLPSSTSSSSPTALGPTQQVSIEFYTSQSYVTSNPTISGTTGSLTVAGQSVSVSTSTSVYETAAISPTLHLYAVKITLTGTFTPSASQFGTSLTFVWTASVTVTGQIYGQTSSTQTYYAGSSTNYGSYEQPLQNLGEFGISASGYAFQYITPSSNVSMEFSSLPQPITFWYVELNGTTLGASEVYVTVNGVQYVLWDPSLGITASTTMNGYTAYNTVVHLGAGAYTIDGYVTNASSGNNLELMSFGMQMPGTSIKVLTLNQEVSIGAGAFLAIIGLALIVRRLV